MDLFRRSAEPFFHLEHVGVTVEDHQTLVAMFMFLVKDVSLLLGMF